MSAAISSVSWRYRRYSRFSERLFVETRVGFTHLALSLAERHTVNQNGVAAISTRVDGLSQSGCCAFEPVVALCVCELRGRRPARHLHSFGNGARSSSGGRGLKRAGAQTPCPTPSMAGSLGTKGCPFLKNTRPLRRRSSALRSCGRPAAAARAGGRQTAHLLIRYIAQQQPGAPLDSPQKPRARERDLGRRQAIPGIMPAKGGF